jgi:hypothetical protein
VKKRKFMCGFSKFFPVAEDTGCQRHSLEIEKTAPPILCHLVFHAAAVVW